MNPDDFTLKTLAALQLDACQQAQVLLDSHAQRSLPSLHAELTRQHLDHCDDCRELYSAVMRINAHLPALRSLRVPPGFTDSLLKKTVQRPGAPQLQHRPRRLRTWMMRPRFAMESAYAMTVIVMLFSGFTGVNAIDALDSAMWERARPRLMQPPFELQQLSNELAIRAEQQTEKIQTTYDNTTQALHSWTQEKYAAFTERITELVR